MQPWKYEEKFWLIIWNVQEFKTLTERCPKLSYRSICHKLWQNDLEKCLLITSEIQVTPVLFCSPETFWSFYLWNLIFLSVKLSICASYISEFYVGWPICPMDKTFLCNIATSSLWLTVLEFFFNNTIPEISLYWRIREAVREYKVLGLFACFTP